MVAKINKCLVNKCANKQLGKFQPYCETHLCDDKTCNNPSLPNAKCCSRHCCKIKNCLKIIKYNGKCQEHACFFPNCDGIRYCSKEPRCEQCKNSNRKNL